MSDRETAAQPSTAPAAWDGVDETVVLLAGAAALGHWVADHPLGSLVGALWTLLYAAALARLVRRCGSAWLTWTLTHQPALCVLLALALASCLWSLHPMLTLVRAASLLGTTLLGVFIGFACPPRRLMQGLYWMFVLLIAASITVGLLFPTPVGDGIPVGWRGVMAHKNSLGAAALVATLYFLIITVARQVHPLWGATLCAGSLFTLAHAHSRTSLVALLFSAAIAAPVAVAWTARRPTGRLLWRLSLGLIVMVSIVPFLVGPVASRFGNDDPLNGRTFIWSGALTILRERPLTGYGYGVVWGRASATLLPHIRITAHRSATTAHNSIINVATELGIPAAIVACAYLVAALRNAGRLFARAPSAFSAFAFMFLVAVAVVGFAESLLLRIHASWILFVAVTVAVTRALDAAGDRPAESPPG